MAMALGRFKNIPFIYNCRDLYPDVAWELGKLNKQSIFSKVFDLLNKKSFLKACSVIVLGQSMQQRIIDKGVIGGRIKIIPDWVDVSVVNPVAKGDNYFLEKFGLKNKFVVMYSGNIGLSQDFSSILKSIARLTEEELSGLCLVFVGGGAGKKALKDEVESSGLKNVLFFPYQPIESLSFVLSMADLHLIPLKKGMKGAVVPSKLYNILAVGRPYLAIADEEGEPACLARECGCGLWATPGNMTEIADGIKWAIGHQGELQKMGKAGRDVAEKRFRGETVVNSWFEILDGCLIPRGAPL
jgi:colanic acid biosynthesis glycosyl transferase WcaI